MIKLRQCGTLADFKWKAVKQHASVRFLYLWCPLRTNGTLGWETRLYWNTGRLHVLRTTNLMGRGIKRTLCTGQDRRVAWDQIHIYPGPTFSGTRAHTHRRLRQYRDDPTTFLTEADREHLPTFWAGLTDLIAGCFDAGAFQPVVDWVIENSPMLAPLFTEPGDLR